jgi:hypothetical protein
MQASKSVYVHLHVCEEEEEEVDPIHHVPQVGGVPARWGPMGCQRWGPMGYQRWGPMGCQRWGPMGCQRWGPMGCQRWGPMGYQRWGPMGYCCIDLRSEEAAWGPMGCQGWVGSQRSEEGSPPCDPRGWGSMGCQRWVPWGIDLRSEEAAQVVDHMKVDGLRTLEEQASQHTLERPVVERGSERVRAKQHRRSSIQRLPDHDRGPGMVRFRSGDQGWEGSGVGTRDGKEQERGPGMGRFDRSLGPCHASAPWRSIASVRIERRPAVPQSTACHAVSGHCV